MKTYPFTEVAGLEGVLIARVGKLNCTAIRLRDGGVCLYSPVAGLEISERDSLLEVGPVSSLLAPNHYHNKGLKGHVEAFPDASLVCSMNAKQRLQKITGLTFEPLDTLQPLLAENQTILEPQGLKTGEVWIQVETGSDIVWIVTDALSSSLQPPGSYVESACMLGTFPRYGVEDASVFRDWFTEQLTAVSPTIVLPCHGSPIKSSDLSAQLTGILVDAL